MENMKYCLKILSWFYNKSIVDNLKSYWWINSKVGQQPTCTIKINFLKANQIRLYSFSLVELNDSLYNQQLSRCEKS